MAVTHHTHPGEHWAGRPAHALPNVLPALRALAARMRRRFLAFAWDLEAEGGYTLAARPLPLTSRTSPSSPSTD
jgi:hypothetical protein